MWGPPSAMVEGPSVSGLQGIVPRIFQNLFSEIQKVDYFSQGSQLKMLDCNLTIEAFCHRFY